jgi:hypothetical protein
MVPEILSGLGNAPAQERKPFTGVHYAREAIKGDVLHGDKRGSTGEGEESDRVFLPPRGAPSAIHVYESTGGMYGKHPQIVARPHAYQVDGMYALADIDHDQTWKGAKDAAHTNAMQSGSDPAHAEQVSRNEGEWALKDAGYDGYRASRSAPGNVVLFGDHIARRLGKAKTDGGSAAEAHAHAHTNADIDMPHPHEADTHANVDDRAASTFASSAHAFPIHAPGEHESHAPNADPARLV